MRKNNVPRSLHCEGLVILNTCKAWGREGFAVARVEDKMRNAEIGSRKISNIWANASGVAFVLCKVAGNRHIGDRNRGQRPVDQLFSAQCLKGAIGMNQGQAQGIANLAGR